MMQTETQPNLFVIGAPKCGTTAIYHALRGLPDVTMSRVKETGFFANDALFPMGIDHYMRSYFPGVQDTRYRGEVSPWYLYQLETIARLQATLEGPLTIVAVVRNPADRAISMYFDQRSGGYEARLPEAALDPDAEPAQRFEMQYLEHGHYSRYLRAWQQAFGDHLHVVPAPSQNSIGTIQRGLAAALEIDIPEDFLLNQSDSQRNLAGQSPNSGVIRFIKFAARSRRLKLAARRVLPAGFDQRLMAHLAQRGRVYGRPSEVEVPSSVVSRLDAYFEQEVDDMLRDWGISLEPNRSIV